jgi:hypothetical protein
MDPMYWARVDDLPLPQTRAGALESPQNQPDVYEVSHAEYAKAPVRPFFLGESTYEGEHGAWGGELQAHKQAYWCKLGGGNGRSFSMCA